MEAGDMKRLLCSGLLFVSIAAPAAASASALSEALSASYEAETAKDYSAAIRPLKDIEPKYHDHYLLSLRLGWLSYCAGLWNESAAYYQAAAKLAPKAVEPLQGLALPLAAAGKTKELIQTHERILKLDPANYKSLAALAWQHYLAKNYGQAADYYRQAVALYPTDTEMLVGLAASLAGDGDKKAAEKYYRNVLLLCPTDPRAKDFLGVRR
jgi:tetratricopeptide (TPR) repeat protein